MKISFEFANFLVSLFFLLLWSQSSIAETLAYITNARSNSISVINVEINEVVSTITSEVGRYPYGVAATPNGAYVYVSNRDSGFLSLIDTVSVISTATNAVIATIPVGNGPNGIAVNPTGSYVYVANSDDGSVSVISTATNAVIATIPVGNEPYGVAVTPNGSYVYIANRGSDTVSVISTALNKVVSTISVGNEPNGVVVIPNGSYVYVVNRNPGAYGSVSVISTVSNTVTTTIPVGRLAFGINVTPDGSKVYVSNRTDDSVSVISTASNTVDTTVTVGDDPIGISVTPDGSKVYVANGLSRTVSVISTASDTVLATIAGVGTLPIAFGSFISPPPPLPQPLPPPTYTLGGLITGLRVAADLTLLNNGGNPFTVSQSGAFNFPNGIQTGSSYSVTVGTQPPGQTCTVINGSGVANANVNNLEVRCVNSLYRIGGTVTGLAADQRVWLVNNGVESLQVSANGAFRFGQGVAWNGRYNVVVGAQPTNQTCTVTGGTGYNVQSNVTDIRVNCGEILVNGLALPRSGLIYAACGSSSVYHNMNYDTAPGRENTARIAACALANIRLTYPDFFNDSVVGKHELIGGIEVQGVASNYLATSTYGMVTLLQKTSGQILTFQVTRPQPGPNNSGINVNFLNGSIGFTSHLTSPLPQLPNGRWTMWITRGGNGTEGWGAVSAIQLFPDAPVDLGQVGEALNPNVNSQAIDWSHGQ